MRSRTAEVRARAGSNGTEIGPAALGEAVLAYGLAAVVGMDADGRVCEFSPVAEEMFGVRREDVLGRNLADTLIPAEHRDEHRQGLRRLHDTGEARILGRQIQVTALRADGSAFPVELTVTQVLDTDPPTFVAFMRDISERLASERALADSRRLLDRAETLAGAGSFEQDLRTDVGHWSDGLYRIFGLPVGRESRPLKDLLALLHPDDRDSAREHFSQMAVGGAGQFYEQLRIVRPDGRERTLELRGEVLTDPDGTAERLVGVARDVTDEVQEARIRDFLSQIVESTEDCIYSVSRDGIIMSWNRGAEKIFGYKTEEAVGQPKRMLVPRGLEDEQSELMQRVFSGEAVTGVQTHRVRKDRSVVPVSLTMSPVQDGRGRVVSAAVLARDETERRRYEQQLQQLADHDTLTGLFNRRRFAEELRRELSRASRSGTGGAVLSVDLDGFKAINDSAGHAAGDAVLAEIGRTLIRHVRGSDVVGRMGGDEFGVLLPEAGREQALAGAEHLLHAIQDCSVNVEGTTFSVTASIGVTLFGADTTSAEELLTGADLAMYSAKEQGRDRIVAFTPDEARTARAGAKLRWSRRLRQALDQDELVLHWQPILDLNSGRVTHGELLLRLRDREKLIYPEAFLAAAEQLGLIHAIDCWVVTTAIRLLAEGREPASLPLSVNLSSKSVAGNPQLLEVIKHELQAHGVDPARLILEITETAAIADIGEARGFAAELKRLGCRLALDDFGTGFASFFHLKHLPVDFIKIDREFIHDLLQSVIDQRLVRGMVHTARNLGLQTVAEAVESRRTLELLRRLGVDYVQGYHVGEPRPVELPAARA